MSRRKRPSDSPAPTADSTPPEDAVKVEAWTERRQPIKREFPVSDTAGVPFRVAMDREAFADVTAHAREQLDCEICGILAGELCRDQQGEFIQIRAAVRGQSVRQGSAHVTFTQETWNQIHKEMEAKHKKLQIVGWYHSHPGFGVTFSDMDTFIQTNFFGAPHQIALVTDPLGGETAACVTRDGNIRYIPRLWVDGRPQTCYVPPTDSAADPDNGNTASRAIDTTEIESQLAALDMRLSQVTQALDDTRNDFYRLLLFTFILVCTSVLGWVGWNFYKSYTDVRVPPEPMGYYTEVIKVGDRNVRLSLAVLGWDIPEDISLKSIERDKMRRELLEQIYQQLEEQQQQTLDGLPARPSQPPPLGRPAAEPEPTIPMRRLDD